MITKIIDGNGLRFEEISAMKYNEISKEYIKTGILDLTKEEILDITKTYYISLQELEKKVIKLSELWEKINTQNLK